MAEGIRSPMLMLTMMGSMAPSGRDSRSNCSRSLVAAISRLVPSTYVICSWLTPSEEVELTPSTPDTDMMADSRGRVTSSSMSEGLAPL